MGAADLLLEFARECDGGIPDLSWSLQTTSDPGKRNHMVGWTGMSRVGRQPIYITTKTNILQAKDTSLELFIGFHMLDIWNVRLFLVHSVEVDGHDGFIQRARGLVYTSMPGKTLFDHLLEVLFVLLSKSDSLFDREILSNFPSSGRIPNSKHILSTGTMTNNKKNYLLNDVFWEF